jgi:hypothetical protein
LTVSHAFVSKINAETCEDGSVKATGVQVIMPDGGELTVNIEDGGEVILSAGVFKTPQLLELSGIGDPDVLQPLGIEVKHELKGVGRNYEEQCVSWIPYIRRHSLISISPLTILTYELQEPYLSFDALDYNATLVAEVGPIYSTFQDFRWLIVRCSKLHFTKKGRAGLWDPWPVMASIAMYWHAYQTFAQAVTDFEPISIVLTSEDIAEAEEILQEKPDSILQEEFDIIKGQILGGTPQVEYILVSGTLLIIMISLT